MNKRIISLGILAASVLGIGFSQPKSANADSWHQTGGVWYLKNNQGQNKTGWQTVGSSWYYLNNNGVMAVGWQKIGNTWYFLNGSGAMMTGWQKINNNWYFLEVNGAMIANQSRNINGQMYSFDASGKMLENNAIALASTRSVSTNSRLQNVEGKLVTLINQLRSSKGLSTLSINQNLVTAARIRAKETEGLFSHTRPDGRICSTILEEVGLSNFSYYGENIASYTSNRNYSEDEMAKKIFDQWVKSPLHYKNMVKPTYREVAFGVVKSGNKVLATTQFYTR